MSVKAAALRALLPLLALFALSASAQQAAASLKVAIIDSDRIVAESTRGKAALERLRGLQEQKIAEAQRLQQEMSDLRKRMEDGRLSLAPDKLDELRKQLQDKGIALERFQADAQRELEEEREKALAAIERDVLTVINQVGQEQGYTLIFNKFRSGLVFASDAVDITPLIIQRFDAASRSGG
jgi:outer membrane protein